MLIYLDIKIPHLKIAHLGGNLEVGNIKIHRKRYYFIKNPFQLELHSKSLFHKVIAMSR